MDYLVREVSYEYVPSKKRREYEQLLPIITVGGILIAGLDLKSIGGANSYTVCEAF